MVLLRPSTVILVIMQKARDPLCKIAHIKRPLDCAAQQRHLWVTKYENLILDLRLVVQNDIQ